MSCANVNIQVKILFDLRSICFLVNHLVFCVLCALSMIVRVQIIITCTLRDSTPDMPREGDQGGGGFK